MIRVLVLALPRVGKLVAVFEQKYISVKSVRWKQMKLLCLRCNLFSVLDCVNSFRVIVYEVVYMKIKNPVITKASCL